LERENIKSERKLLKQKYGALYDMVAALLFEADPTGINFSDNTDEYEPEAGTILPRLVDAKTVDDVQAIVHEEFCRWFDVEDAGPREKYSEVSVKIWKAWQAAFEAASES
jgi:hypothetical protein